MNFYCGSAEISKIKWYFNNNSLVVILTRNVRFFKKADVDQILSRLLPLTLAKRKHERYDRIFGKSH